MPDVLRHYLEELERFQRRVEDLYRGTVQSAAGHPDNEPGHWKPPADVVELQDGWLIQVELPGISRDEMRLEAHGDGLTLEGRREPPRETLTFQRMERVHGPFRRHFRLNGELDADGVEAEVRHGVLEIRVPRREKQSIKLTDAEASQE